jgi:hypothetical protein
VCWVRTAGLVKEREGEVQTQGERVVNFNTGAGLIMCVLIIYCVQYLGVSIAEGQS